MKRLVTASKYTAIVLGCISLFVAIASFTTWPYRAYSRLSHPRFDTCAMNANYIVMLSGCGMPSADGLLKCYYVSEAKEIFPTATIVVAMPCDTASEYSRDIAITNAELNLHGIDTTTIIYEKNGINTRKQALYIKNLLPEDAINDTLLIIAQPEQVKRTLLTFKSIGFRYVTGCASESEPLSEDLLKQKKTTDNDEESFNASLALRYNFWNYMKLQITVAREQVALAYYKIRGWI